MALHPNFPKSPYAPLIPEQRWFPADETLRARPMKSCCRRSSQRSAQEVHAWRNKGYPGAFANFGHLLRHWFETEHLIENADGSLSTFRYYFAQREAVETVIWLYEVRQARDKYDLLRFDASGRGFHRNVRRGLAALRLENGDRARENQSPLPAHCVEFLPQTLRAGFHAVPEFSRHRAEYHRAGPAPRRF